MESEAQFKRPASRISKSPNESPQIKQSPNVKQKTSSRPSSDKKHATNATQAPQEDDSMMQETSIIADLSKPIAERRKKRELNDSKTLVQQVNSFEFKKPEP